MDSYARHLIAIPYHRTPCGIDVGGVPGGGLERHSRRTSVSVVHELLQHVDGPNHRGSTTGGEGITVIRVLKERRRCEHLSGTDRAPDGERFREGCSRGHSRHSNH